MREKEAHSNRHVPSKAVNAVKNPTHKIQPLFSLGADLRLHTARASEMPSVRLRLGASVRQGPGPPFRPLEVLLSTTRANSPAHIVPRDIFVKHVFGCSAAEQTGAEAPPQPAPALSSASGAREVSCTLDGSAVPRRPPGAARGLRRDGFQAVMKGILRQDPFRERLDGADEQPMDDEAGQARRIFALERLFQGLHCGKLKVLQSQKQQHLHLLFPKPKPACNLAASI